MQNLGNVEWFLRKGCLDLSSGRYVEMYKSEKEVYWSEGCLVNVIKVVYGESKTCEGINRMLIKWLSLEQRVKKNNVWCLLVLLSICGKMCKKYGQQHINMLFRDMNL